MPDEFELVLYGADDSVWYLTGAGAEVSPARLMEGEVSQLYMSPRESVYRPRVGAGGASYRGSRDLPALFPLRLDFIGPDWQENLARFGRALRIDRDAVLEMTSGGGQVRRLVIREHEGPAVLNEHYPGENRAVMVEWPVIAPEPYWTLPEPLTAEWQATPGRITGELVIGNPGDVPAWPRYALTAPAGWVLPDVDHEEPDAPPRVVEIPFLPWGRDALVDTDPLQLTVEPLDRTLAPLAGMRGAHFLHPLPPYSEGLVLPVALDPMPGLQLAIPDEWKLWLSLRLQDAADAMGLAEWVAMTPAEVGDLVYGMITSARPDWLPDLSEGLLAKITANAIADAWAEHYGQWSVVDGTAIQVQVMPRWRSPL